MTTPAEPAAPTMPPAPAMPEPAVDWSALRELGEAMADPDLAADVAAAYLAELPRRRDALARALDQQPTVLADAAHTLKAASMSVGARPLGRLCADTEARARAGDADTARSHGVAALAEIDRVQREMSRATGQGSNR